MTGLFGPSTRVTGLESLRVPGWVTTRADNGLMSGCVQFHCRFMSFHEEWFHVPPADVWQEINIEPLSHMIVSAARAAYDKKWMGTGRDMHVTGGAFYGPEGWSDPVHIKDIP